jgi:hypothetical protein
VPVGLRPNPKGEFATPVILRGTERSGVEAQNPSMPFSTLSLSCRGRGRPPWGHRATPDKGNGKIPLGAHPSAPFYKRGIRHPMSFCVERSEAEWKRRIYVCRFPLCRCRVVVASLGAR